MEDRIEDIEPDEPPNPVEAITQVEANRSTGPSCGGAVYTLGVIGALVWLWPRAYGARERALAVGKALVWPAILVHRAFAWLESPSPDAAPEG